jgi:hypothetical protein
MDPQQQQLRTWFDAIDTNRSGELDATELQQALRLGNLHFGLTDVVSKAAENSFAWCLCLCWPCVVLALCCAGQLVQPVAQHGRIHHHAVDTHMYSVQIMCALNNPNTHLTPSTHTCACHPHVSTLLLPAARCPLPAACCLLPAACCLLPAACCCCCRLQDQMIRAFDTTNSRSLNFHEFQRLHYFLVNVQGSFQHFDV